MTQNIKATNHSSSFFENAAYKATETVKAIGSNSYKVVALGVDAASKIKNNSAAALKVFRCGRYILLGAQELKGRVSVINLRNQLVIADKVLDVFLFIGDIDYFVNGRFKKDGEPINKLTLMGNIFISAVDFAGVCTWLDSLKILDLASVASSMGKIPVLKILTTVNLGTYIGVTALIGVGFFTADAVKRAVNAENKEQRVKALIDLATLTTKAALVTFTLSGGTNIPALVVLGTLSSGLGIAAFLYGEYNSEALSAPKKIEVVAA